MGNNPKLLNEYLYDLKAVRNFADSTIEGYNNDLLLFFKFLKEYIGIGLEVKDFNLFVFTKVGDREVTSFLVYLNYYRNAGSSSRKRKIHAIRNFYKWLSINYPKQNIQVPMEDYFVEEEIRIPKYLTLDEAKKIKEIFNNKNSKKAERNNLIIDIFFITGIRISELVNIQVSKINFEDNYIKIIAKWNKERKVFITEKLKNRIKKYIKDNNIQDYLFIGRGENKIKRNSIARIIKNAYKLAGIDDRKYTTHTLRHTSASILYQHTEDILIVKEFLGHSSIVSSQIYTHIHNNRVKEAVERNPLNIL